MTFCHFISPLSVNLSLNVRTTLNFVLLQGICVLDIVISKLPLVDILHIYSLLLFDSPPPQRIVGWAVT